MKPSELPGIFGLINYIKWMFLINKFNKNKAIIKDFGQFFILNIYFFEGNSLNWSISSYLILATFCIENSLIFS